MKKLLAVGTLVLTIGAGSLIAYADSPIIIPNNRNQNNRNQNNRSQNYSVENREDWFKERHSFRRDEIKRALKNGQITEAEAKEWEDHFDYMEEFHNKNRLNNNFMGGRHGECGGNGYGMGMGKGMGMMRGNY